MNGTPTAEAPQHGMGRPASARHHALVQAPVRPLDENGVTASIVGTGLFALASLVMLWLRPRLDARGDGWWLWVCIAGTLLGIVGHAYCRRRASD